MTGNGQGGGKGFSGFDSMVSDIDRDLADLDNLAKSSAPAERATPKNMAIPEPVAAPRAEPAAPKKAIPAASLGPDLVVNHEGTPFGAQILPPALLKKGWNKKWAAWAAGIVVVAIVVLSGKSGNNTPKTMPAAPYLPRPSVGLAPTAPSPKAPVASYPPLSLGKTAAPVVAPFYAKGTATPPAYAAPEKPREEKPPAGNGLTFNESQIRYCLAEDIRMKGMQRHVDHYSHTSVAAFNKYVEDYNSRCSHFRYRSGMLESVKSEVESRRATLDSQGLARSLRNP